MTPLATTQRDFMAAVRGERPAGALAAYRAQALAGWRAALRGAYPVVARLVGDAFFDEAADRYAARHPSTSGDLHEYGRAFAAFIAAYAPASGLPYLADVSRLEWAVHESSFAADATLLDFATLDAVPPPRQADVIFELHPAARWVASPHPILALWEANQPDRDGTPSRFDEADRVLVARPGERVVLHRLDDAEACCLEAILRGVPLGGVIDALGTQALRAPGLLQRLAAAGAIAGFHLS